MKRVIGLAVVAALLGSACAPGAQARAAVDPVCGIEVAVSKAETASLTSVWKGAEYHFCSPECKARFDKAPMMYHAKCPVCNGTVQKTAALAAEHGDRTYYFDSAQHRASFLWEPARYLGELETDVVCGMEVVRSKAVEAGLTVEHAGKTFYFCGAGCKDKFLKDPEGFVGERTSVCPPCGMTVVRKDAEAAGLTSVHQGVTYYFCASSCKRDFERNPDRYLRRMQ